MKILKVMCNLYPQATDRDFVDKLNGKFKTAPNFEVVRNHTPLFTIVHYAGKVRSHNTRIIITDEFTCVHPVWRAFLCCVQVQYNASGFLEKNRDTIPANIRELFINSVTPLLSVLFAGLSLSLNLSVAIWSHICEYLISEACLIEPQHHVKTFAYGTRFRACGIFIMILKWRRCLCHRSVCVFQPPSLEQGH